MAEAGRRVEVVGHLVAVSHLFYLRRNKCCLVEVQDHSSERRQVAVIALEHKDTLLALQNGQVLPGCGVSLSRCARLASHNWLKFTGQSRLKPGGDFLSGLGELHEGIVTDDSQACSGLYTLSQKILLMTTALCHITNIGRFRRGQCLMVSNAHLCKFPGHGLVLIACSRSLVTVKGEARTSLHDRSTTEAFGRDTVVNLALKFNLGPQDVLDLIEARKNWAHSFPDVDLARLNAVGSNPLDVLLHDWPVSNRSLITEFTEHPVKGQCHVHLNATPDERQPRARLIPRKLGELRELRELLDRDLTEERSLRQGCHQRPSSIVYDYCTSSGHSDRPLTGVLALEPSLGRMVLRDASGFIPLAISGPLIPSHVNQLVHIRDYVGILEWIELPGQALEYRYVSCDAADIQIVTPLPPQTPPSGEAAERTVLVRNVSQPVYSLDAFYVFVQAASGFWKIPLQILSVPTLEPGSEVTFSDLSTKSEYSHISSSVSGYISGSSLKSVLVPSLRTKVHLLAKSSDPLNECYYLDQLAVIPEGEMVSISGIVSERWIEVTKYPKEEPPIAHERVEASLPNRFHLQIKLQRESNQMETMVSVYAMSLVSQLYPLGILPKRRIQIHNVIKVSSKQGRPYFVNTSLTRFRALGRREETRAQRSEDNAITYLSQASASLGHVFQCRVTLESIVRLSLRPICSACDNPAPQGHCAFVGCHRGAGNLKFSTKGQFLVEDGTRRAMLYFNDLPILREILGFTEDEWLCLLEQVTECGEVLHIKGGKDLSRDANPLHLLCSLIPETRHVKLLCLCRHFSPKSSPDTLANNGDEPMSLFCTSMSILGRVY